MLKVAEKTRLQSGIVCTVCTHLFRPTQ